MIKDAQPGFNKFMARLLTNDYSFAFMRGYDSALDAANNDVSSIPCPYMVSDGARYKGFADGFDAGRQYVIDIFSGISWRKRF